MIIRALANKPTDSKEAFYFLLCEVNQLGQYNECKRMQDTFSPLMFFSKLLLEHLFKENFTILCINANFTRNFALVSWPH